MEINRSESAGTVTLALKGCLDTAATNEFAAAVDATEGAQALVLQMDGLEFISSSALRVLVSLRKKRGANFSVTLCGMNEVVKEVFDVTGLNAVFTVRD